MNILQWLLIPIIFIGADVAVILLVALIFFLIKFKKTSKKTYLYISIVIVLLFLYSAIDVSFPQKGNVLNALNGDPVEDIEVTRAFKVTNNVLNPGGESPHLAWYQKAVTDKDGLYSFPISIHLKLPFLTTFSDTRTFVDICDKSDKSLPCFGSYLFPKEKFSNGRSSYNDKFADEFNIPGPFYETLMAEVGLIESNIYLIPKLNKIEECDMLVKKELAPLCKDENGTRAAIYSRSTKPCVQTFGNLKKYCIIKIATLLGDAKICSELTDVIPTYEYNSDRGLCLSRVATANKDKILCASIPNGEWSSVIDDQGHTVESCVIQQIPN